MSRRQPQASRLRKGTAFLGTFQSSFANLYSRNRRIPFPNLTVLPGRRTQTACRPNRHGLPDRPSGTTSTRRGIAFTQA